MVCGYLPFEDADTSKVYNKILMEEYQEPEFLSDKVKDILKKVLSKDPKTRYRIEDIKRHSWYHLVDPIEEKGIIIGYTPIPVDLFLLAELNKLGINQNYTKKCLETNRHNEVITTYYLLLKKRKREEKKKKSKIKLKNIKDLHSVSTAYKGEIKYYKGPLLTGTSNNNMQYKDTSTEYASLKFFMKQPIHKPIHYKSSSRHETPSYTREESVLRANAIHYSQSEKMRRQMKHKNNLYQRIASQTRTYNYSNIQQNVPNPYEDNKAHNSFMDIGSVRNNSVEPKKPWRHYRQSKYINNYIKHNYIT